MRRRTKKEIPKKIRNRTESNQALLKIVRQYQFLMKLRIAISNQLAAGLRMQLFDPEIIDAYTEEHVKPLEKQEGQIIRGAGKLIRDTPLWKHWLFLVRGIGENLAAQLIAHIDPIGDFPTVSHLWAYAGYKVVDGVAVRRTRGRRSNWNPDLKKVCYLVAVSFEKAGGPYRKLYDEYKARDRAAHPKPDKPTTDEDGETDYKYSDGHIRMRALRHTVKIFLSHLWQVWRELEGLPTRPPYPVEYLGHEKNISPRSMIESQPMHETLRISASPAPSEEPVSLCEPRAS
jgi:hypothetical protein